MLFNLFWGHFKTDGNGKKTKKGELNEQGKGYVLA